MPEGHTIHRLAREHRAVLPGRPIRAASPQGRFADGAARLDGRSVTRVDPYGKHLFYGFGDDTWLHVHLGLYGTFVTGPLPAPEPRGALRLRMSTDGAYVDLRGPTACELLAGGERRQILARLGPDPLRRDGTPEPAWQRMSASRTPVAALLMDQSVLAGVGNVYRAEILFRWNVDPFRPGRELAEELWLQMWADLRTLMRAGVRAGHIVTTRRQDRDRRTGAPALEDRFYVYRRTDLPCRVCGTPVRTRELVGRNLYWCPVCQAA
ncbi:MAG: Fpg/Nei family DNA glycosylase [Actinomycetota bacterium]|nr:Fpg/Nei family DNA glycosylase [Actinomycetota bacterium]